MAELRESLSLYRLLIAARVRAQLQYRTSFAIETVAAFLVSFLDFVAILVIFSNVPQLGTWSVAQVALLYALATLSFAFTDLVIGHLDGFPALIRDGNFDLMLVRPKGTLFQVITGDFQLRRLGRVAQALLVLGYALNTLAIDWTPDRALVLALTVPSGVLIYGSVWVAVICIAFWTVEGREAANAFTYGGAFLAQYPMNIFDRWLRRFLGYFVPMAFIAYFPALHVLGKTDPLGLPAVLQVASPVVALAAAVVASTVWRFAVRHYQSAGG
ncbi:MAG: ABC transporter permease [Chloroflexi bacterium]|nr:MAG: ABC transporter permease [Chloroflexota bacterium]